MLSALFGIVLVGGFLTGLEFLQQHLVCSSPIKALSEDVGFRYDDYKLPTTKSFDTHSTPPKMSIKLRLIASLALASLASGMCPSLLGRCRS